MRGTSDPENKQSETTRGQQCCEKVERVRGARRMRQGFQADQNSDQAEWNVDGEQPGPGPDSQNARRDGRPERESGGDHQCIMTVAAAEHTFRIDIADQRGVDAHEAARAQPLQRARQQQALQ
jgi:hypothetical protein